MLQAGELSTCQLFFAIQTGAQDVKLNVLPGLKHSPGSIFFPVSAIRTQYPERAIANI
jgi:hypothetical protein